MKSAETKSTHRVVAYWRISTEEQDINAQKLELYEYARKNDLQIDEFVETRVSSGKSTQARKINELLQNLESGDLLLVSELSRLGRSIGQIIQIIDSQKI